MFKQKFTITRPNTDAEFWPRTPQYAEKQQIIEDLRAVRTDLVTGYENTISEDQLVYTAIVTFSSEAAWTEFTRYLRGYKLIGLAEAEQYYIAHNHSYIVENITDENAPVLLNKINC